VNPGPSFGDGVSEVSQNTLIPVAPIETLSRGKRRHRGSITLRGVLRFSFLVCPAPGRCSGRKSWWYVCLGVSLAAVFPESMLQRVVKTSP